MGDRIVVVDVGEILGLAGAVFSMIRVVIMSAESRKRIVCLTRKKQIFVIISSPANEMFRE
jgi:23S rRNA U2552 (ribose-2'-O)-methylase RlmE/FtsJ